MKTSLVLLMLFFQTAYTLAQESATKEIKDKIAAEFNKWLEKSEFETNAAYEARIKNKSDETLKSISDKVVSSLKPNEYPPRLWGKLGIYDAENETYLIDLYAWDFYGNAGSSFPLIKFTKDDPILVKVSLSIAADLSKKLNQRDEYGGNPCEYSITIIPNKFTIINDKWTLTDALLIFFSGCYDARMLCAINTYPLGFVITQGENGDVYGECPYNSGYGKLTGEFKIKDFKTIAKGNTLPSDNLFYYKWSIADQPNYDPSSTKPISFTLEDLNITLPTISTNTQTVSSTKPQVPDLDMNSIQTKNKNSNAFAVVIGNKDYQNTKKVSFAINDAQTIKKYLINVLGYSEGNIFYLENASKSNFETYFGTKENPQGKLFNNIKQEISDVFIYYAGHGAPGLKDNKGYFVPIDCDPQYVEQGGYSLDLFYNNIAKLKAKSITVVTDACFSGAEIFNNISPIVITVSNPIAVADNCVVLSSSTGTQVSSWYNDKQHGIFTYFFLKALQDKDKSDKNKDGKLSFKEIFEYVSDKTEGVPYYARSIHGVDQTPAIQGTGIDNIFIEYK